ncbi:hypothetical protein V8C35DRAFT_304297 [Trichoderma chlorosporum]
MHAKNLEATVQVQTCLQHSTITWACAPSATEMVYSVTFSGWNIIATWGLTAALNLMTAQYSKQLGYSKETCWKIYPMCDAWALEDHIRLPSFIGQQNSCEVCLLLVAIMTCLHWSCVFGLFSLPRWNDQFLHKVILATIITLLPLASIVRDPATVFLRLLPIVTDFYISACYIFDCAYERELDS